jgi:hypothetical protein
VQDARRGEKGPEHTLGGLGRSCLARARAQREEGRRGQPQGREDDAGRQRGWPWEERNGRPEEQHVHGPRREDATGGPFIPLGSVTQKSGKINDLFGKTGNKLNDSTPG